MGNGNIVVNLVVTFPLDRRALMGIKSKSAMIFL